MNIPAGPFSIKPEITVGDILTLMTIGITLGTLYSAWLQSKRLKEKEMADTIRSACATVLGKLERWQELSLSLFETTQPIYIDTSELLARKLETSELMTRSRTVIEARDYLWKRLTVTRNAIRQSILNEKLELAYTDLYSYSPKLVESFMAVLSQLKTADASTFSDFLEKTQADVLAYTDQLGGYTSAMLGNDLRTTSQQLGDELQIRFEQAIEPFKQKLTALLQESDKQLLQKRKEWDFA